MSKAAMNMGAKLLSLDLKDAGVAVVILHPGVVATDMLRDFFSLPPVRDRIRFVFSIFTRIVC